MAVVAAKINNSLSPDDQTDPGADTSANPPTSKVNIPTVDVATTPAPAPTDPAAPPAPAPAPSTPPAGSGAVSDAIGASASSPPPQVIGPTAAPPAAATPAAGTTGTAVLRNLDEQKDTVAGRLATLMQGSNPIIAQARASALKAANDRGTANSSMAAQAGEEAAVGSMMPVAQQDASTSFAQGRADQDVQNQFELTHETFEHQNEMQGKDIASNTNIAQIGAAAEVTAAGEHASAAVEAAQIGAEASKQMQTAQIEANKQAQQLDGTIRDGLLDKQIAANAGLQDGNLTFQREVAKTNAGVTTQNAYSSQYTAILTDPNMSAEDKTNALVHLNAIYGGSPYLPPGIVTTSLPAAPPPPNPGQGNSPGSGG